MQAEKKAFTLIEAIFTTAIIGILAAVILPRFMRSGFIQGPVLRSSVSQIVSDIRYARELAVTNSDHYLINFDFTQKQYSIYKNSIRPTNRIGQIKNVSPDLSISGTGQFDFYSLGNAVFSGQGLDILVDGKPRYKISVEPPSGAVVAEKLS